jgi:hypothetical protein
MITLTLYLTKEKCAKIAQRYANKEDFFQEANVAFNISVEFGWIDEICMHMNAGVVKQNEPKTRNKRNFWTKQRCIEESLNYKTLQEFKKQSNWVYNKLKKNNWLKHIKLPDKPKYKAVGYWTINTCKEEALKYDALTDFIHNSTAAYYQTWKNQWIDEVCDHLVKYKRKKQLQ